MKINLDNLKNKNKMKNVILTCLLTFTVISLSFAQLKVVAPDGNVGIGTSTPTAKLQVDGNTQIIGIARVLGVGGGAAAAKVQVGKNRTAAGNAIIETISLPGVDFVGKLQSTKDAVTTFTHKGPGQFQLRTLTAASKMIFVTNNGTSERSRLMINDEGKIGIGTDSPTQALHVVGNAIKSVGGTGWSVTSDKRLKSNIQEFSSGLDDILRINPVSFSYNGKAGTTPNTKEVGVIAQEFKEISPESVFTFKHTEYTPDADDLDKPYKKGATEEYLGVNSSRVTWMLVNAVKEQQAIINDLKNQVEEISKVGFTAPVATDHVHYSTVVLNGEEEKAMLAQNAPNPFTTNTKIDYFVPSNSKAASMSFTDITGKEIKRINIDHTGLGTLDVSIADMPIGIYSYSLVVNGSTIASKKMVLSK